MFCATNLVKMIHQVTSFGMDMYVEDFTISSHGMKCEMSTELVLTIMHGLSLFMQKNSICYGVEILVDYITLFKSITMFYGIDNIPWNIPIFSSKYGEYFVLIPHNIVMDLNNVMYRSLHKDKLGNW